MTKAEFAGRFKRAVCQTGRCTLWSRFDNTCDGPLDAAHWLPAQFLRKRFGDDAFEIIYDPRAARPLCRKHHHLADNGFVRVFREDIPSTCWEWAREAGIEWRLVRDYAPREVGVGA